MVGRVGKKKGRAAKRGEMPRGTKPRGLVQVVGVEVRAPVKQVLSLGLGCQGQRVWGPRGSVGAKKPARGGHAGQVAYT